MSRVAADRLLPTPRVHLAPPVVASEWATNVVARARGHLTREPEDSQGDTLVVIRHRAKGLELAGTFRFGADTSSERLVAAAAGSGEREGGGMRLKRMPIGRPGADAAQWTGASFELNSRPRPSAAADSALLQQHRTPFVDAPHCRALSLRQRDRSGEIGALGSLTARDQKRLQREKNLQALLSPRNVTTEHAPSGLDTDEMRTARLLLSTQLSIHTHRSRTRPPV